MRFSERADEISDGADRVSVGLMRRRRAIKVNAALRLSPH